MSPPTCATVVSVGRGRLAWRLYALDARTARVMSLLPVSVPQDGSTQTVPHLSAIRPVRMETVLPRMSVVVRIAMEESFVVILVRASIPVKGVRILATAVGGVMVLAVLVRRYARTLAQLRRTGSLRPRQY